MSIDLGFKLAMHHSLIAPELLGLLLKKKVKSVKRMQTNYTRKVVEMHADNVFEVVFMDGVVETIHLEIQGKGSHRTMALRVFDYLSRIINQKGDLKTRVRSIVIYVGEGAGTHDDGKWEFGEPSIGFFQYTVVKLWEYSAEAWLELDIPVLLPLIAQTHMDNPEAQLNAAMERIAKLEDKVEAANLIYILGALLKEKGLQKMVDMFISKNEIMESPPIVRDFYLKGHEEGFQEGLEKGEERGIVKTTLNLLQMRQKMRKYDYNSINFALSAMDEATLNEAVKQAALLQDANAFKDWLETL